MKTLRQYDFKVDDVIRFKKRLKSDQMEKILKLTRKHIEATNINRYLHKTELKTPPTFIIRALYETKKQKVPYAILRNINDGSMFPVQLRYLKLLMRKAAHPLTKIFL